MTLTRIFQNFPSHAAALFLLAAIFLGSVSAAFATPSPVIVGRIVSVTGNVRYFDEFSGEWRQVELNQIIAQGEHLNCDSHSRMALRIGSTSIWLDERADLQVGQVGDEALLLRLRRGSVALRLRSGELASLTRIQTREGLVVPASEGLYRVDQLPRATRVLALQGRVRFESSHTIEGQRAWMREGEQLEFEGARIQNQTPMADAFSDWVGSQILAESIDSTTNYRYVAPEVTLSDDLDRYGRWGQWNGRWGRLPDGVWSPPVYLRVYPHAPRYNDRHSDQPADNRNSDRQRDQDRYRDGSQDRRNDSGSNREQRADHPSRQPGHSPGLTEPHGPRSIEPAGNPGGQRPDRPTPTPSSQPGSHSTPSTNTPQLAPVAPQIPGWIQDKRTPEKSAPEEAEREKRGRRTRDMER